MSLKLSGPVAACCAIVPTVSAAIFILAFDTNKLWRPWIVNAFIQAIGYLHSAFNHTEKYYDMCGSFGYIASVVTSLIESEDDTLRSWINSALVITWAARLGRHLVTRIRKDTRDKRFDAMRDSGLKMALPWSMQLLWVTLVPSAVLLLNTKPHVQTSLGVRDVVGWSVWAVGFLLEVVADEQKKDFRSYEENRDQFIHTGLWSRSRHPNYFGEMVLWFGIWLSSSSAFESPIDYLTLLGPLFNFLLLRFISGVPLLEKAADQKWGSSPEYQAYKAKTPLLIPKLF